MRKLSYYSYYSGGGSSWIYGAIIAGVVFVLMFITVLLSWCKRRKRRQQQEVAMQTQMAGGPSYPTPQYATPPYAATPYGAAPVPGYPPPMNGAPPPPPGGIWYNNRSLKREEMEAMSPEQLTEMGGRLGLSDQAHLPRIEYIDLMLATQASMAPAASAPVPPPPPFGNMKLSGGSFKNPSTGLMECGICMEPMGAGTNKHMAVVPCGHAQCFDCLHRIATEGNGTCPVCRKNFFEFQITKIYT